MNYILISNFTSDVCAKLGDFRIPTKCSDEEKSRLLKFDRSLGSWPSHNFTSNLASVSFMNIRHRHLLQIPFCHNFFQRACTLREPCEFVFAYVFDDIYILQIPQSWK